MGESKSRIEPVTCPDCGVRGEVRLAQSGFKNNFPNVVQCKHRQGMAVVTCPSLRPEIDAAHKNCKSQQNPPAGFPKSARVGVVPLQNFGET